MKHARSDMRGAPHRHTGPGVAAAASAGAALASSTSSASANLSQGRMTMLGLEQAKEAAEVALEKERAQRVHLAAENARLSAQLHELRAKQGFNKLLGHDPDAAEASVNDGSAGTDTTRAAATGASDSGYVYPEGGWVSWATLLQDTKAMQLRMQREDATRRKFIAALRKSGDALGPDDESVRQYHAVLDGLTPKDTGGVGDVGLAHLLTVEDRLTELKGQRSALEEHLAYLNRVHAERSSGDPLRYTASSLLAQRLWKLEEHTAALREVVFGASPYGNTHLDMSRSYSVQSSPSPIMNRATGGSGGEGGHEGGETDWALNAPDEDTLDAGLSNDLF
eukprot:m.172522 g.172522  ORF g.172522 m.172522 type:complete len:337 (+) comp13552_c0_seq1:286-1296(+)